MYCFTRKTLVGTNPVKIHLLGVKQNRFTRKTNRFTRKTIQKVSSRRILFTVTSNKTILNWC